MRINRSAANTLEVRFELNGKSSVAEPHLKRTSRALSAVVSQQHSGEANRSREGESNVGKTADGLGPLRSTELVDSTSVSGGLQSWREKPACHDVIPNESIQSRRGTFATRGPARKMPLSPL
jgi:hypothetical protein